MKNLYTEKLPDLKQQIRPAMQLLDQYGNAMDHSGKQAASSQQTTESAFKKSGKTIKKTLTDVKKTAEETAKSMDLSYIDALVEKEVKRLKDMQSTMANSDPAKTVRRSAGKSEPYDPLISTESLKAYLNDDISESTYYKSLKENNGKLISKEEIAAPKEVSKGMEQVRQKTVQAQKSMIQYGNTVSTSSKKSKSSLMSLATGIKAALVMAVTQALRQAYQKVKEFFSQGIQSAIDAPETENLFRTALGGLSDEADAFAQKMNEALGVDPYAAKEMIGTFQQIGTAVGVGEKTALGMSQSMTMLSEDIASLYNVDPNQAFENLQSALTGQGRAVRKYGFVITEQTVKEAAWRNGVAATGQELTEQQKYVARGILLMEQSKNAQGDMAKTLTSVQNMLRTYKSKMQEAGRAFGDAFTPVFESVLPFLNTLAILLQRAGTAFARFTYSLFGKNYDEEKKKQKQVISGFKGIEDAQTSAGEAVEKTAKKNDKTLLGFDKLNKLQEPVKAETGSSSSGGGSSYDPGWGYDSTPTGKNPFEGQADKVSKFFSDVKKAVPKGVFDGFSSSIDKLKISWGGLKKSMGSKNWLQDYLATGFTAATLTATNAVNYFSGGLEVAQGVVNGKPFQVLDGQKDVVTSFISAFAEPPSNVFDTLFGTHTLDSWLTFKQKILDFSFEDWFNEKVKPWFTKEKWQELFTNISKECTEFFTKTLPDFFNVKIPELIDKVVQWFEELPGKIGYAIGHILGEFTRWGEDMWNWFKTEIPKIIAKVVLCFQGLPEKAREKMNGFKTSIRKWREDAKKWFDAELPKMLNNVLDWFDKLPEKAVQAGKNLMKGFWNGIVKMKDWVLGNLSRFFSGLSLGFKNGYESKEEETPIHNVPHFASGNVARSKTYAVFGEYPGAASNPEITTPENLMRQVFRQTLDEHTIRLNAAIPNFRIPRAKTRAEQTAQDGELNKTLRESYIPLITSMSAKLDAVISAIYAIDPSFVIGDETVYRSAVRGGQKEKAKKGGNPVPAV